MRALFLRSKSWQLFLLFCLPIIILLAIKPMAKESMNIVQLLSLPFTIIYFLWIWTLGTELNKNVEKSIRTSAILFKTSMLFLFFYILGMLLIGFSEINISDIFPLLKVVHYPAIFCIFYIYYFVSKNLITVEKSKKAVFSEFTGHIFLLWFFPVGIWIIQPRVNKIFAK